MLNILLVSTSISSMVLQNSLHNFVCKRSLKSPHLINVFNIPVYSVCILLFTALTFWGGLSLYTALLGIVFGIITALSNFYKMRALSSGPMHITLLITTSSMLIPTMSGIFFGEKFSLAKLILALILIVFIYISLDKSSNIRANLKWIIFCCLAFLFQGTIGVLQKVHQSSSHKEETGGFLMVAFICSLIYCLFRTKGKVSGLSKKVVAIGLVCGVCTFLMNFINLKLSGILPSQLIFPLVNGSSIVLSSISSCLIFKERLSLRQFVGLAGGIVCLIAICIV